MISGSNNETEVTTFNFIKKESELKYVRVLIQPARDKVTSYLFRYLRLKVTSSDGHQLLLLFPPALLMTAILALLLAVNTSLTLAIHYHIRKHCHVGIIWFKFVCYFCRMTVMDEKLSYSYVYSPCRGVPCGNTTSAVSVFMNCSITCLSTSLIQVCQTSAILHVIFDSGQLSSVSWTLLSTNPYKFMIVYGNGKDGR